MRRRGRYGTLPSRKVTQLNLVQLRTRMRSSASTPGTGSGSCGSHVLEDRAARAVRYLRVSLTDRCNYRCTYCMPDGHQEFGPRDQLLRLEEVVRVCGAFVRWGVERIRLTGGEPTLRRNLVGLVRELTALRGEHGPIEVVMTTNGQRLGDLASPLRAAGLHAVTVSLDSLDPDRFAAITRRGRVADVIAGIDAALACGFRGTKINTVAIRGFNGDELGATAAFAWERDLIPRFIEIMPMAGGELFVPGQLMASADVRAAIAVQVGGALEPVDGAPVGGIGPARYFRVTAGAWRGRVLGTIGAMTENFCGSCNRLRLSATGQLHGCLAHDDAGDLRAALREGGVERLEGTIRAVLGTKRDGHGFHLDGSGGPDKAMISIGG